jgi:large subunit ribosomal protein L25
MSEVTSLQLSHRVERGKGPCARLRNNGLVPGVFYNSKGENISFSVDNMALGKAFEKVRYSKMIELHIDIDGKTEKRNALFQKLVSHPVKRRYDHVDFIGIDLDKEVEVFVPVKAVGRAKGIVLGGKLEYLRERIKVRCLPTAIPDYLEVNITEMGIGDKIMVDQVPTPAGVVSVFDRPYPVVTVQTARGAKTAEEETEE